MLILVYSFTSYFFIAACVKDESRFLRVSGRGFYEVVIGFYKVEVGFYEVVAGFYEMAVGIL